LGFNYDGMACQAVKDNSVEEYIFKVMHTLSLIPQAFPCDDSFTRAGRTDKGVSAMGNVISLRLRTDIEVNSSSICKLDYCSMLNALLPEDIRIIGCEPVGEDFNARYWCISRRYKYFFARGNLNLELMR
jgi:tRNA pseudouridine38/39 synthase